MIQQHKDFYWLVRLAFWGCLGICLCWLPVVVAAFRAARTPLPFADQMRWEWQSYVLSIEEAIR